MWNSFTKRRNIYDSKEVSSRWNDSANAWGIICGLSLIHILLRYHAYNAANLDGGYSSVMVVNDKIINHPFNWSNREETRPIASGFVVTE